MKQEKNQSVRWKNSLLNLLAMVLGLLVVFILCEIVTRIIYPKSLPEIYPQIFQEDNELGYRLKANFSGIHKHPDFIVTYATNSMGYRDVDHPISKLEGVYRILVLGDSFTFGSGVPMENTYAKVLEKLLNVKDTTRRYEVINTGVPGFGTDQEYNYLIKEGLSLKPDMVIVGFLGMNDIDGVEYGWENYTVKNGYVVKKEGRDIEYKGREFKGFIISRSKFALLMYYKWTKLKEGFQRHGKTKEIPFQVYQDKYSDSFSKAMEKTKEYLLEMKKLCEKHNIQYVVVLIPFEMEVSKTNWVKYQLEDTYSEKAFNENLMKPSKIFSQFGKENHINTLDLVPPFRADHPEKCYFRWEAHWNSQGHQFAAQLLYSYLTSQHIL